MKKLAYTLMIFALVLVMSNKYALADGVKLKFSHSKQTVNAGDTFTLALIADSNVKLGAYDMI